MTLPANLATGNVINESWYDDVVAGITEAQYKQITRVTNTGTGSIATIQTIITLAFNQVNGRRYRIRGFINVTMGGSVGTVTASITDVTPTTLNTCQLSMTATYNGFLAVEHVYLAGATGAVTYLVRAVANVACTMNGSATQVHWGTVDDIGV